jgi:hypothetical protein
MLPEPTPSLNRFHDREPSSREHGHDQEEEECHVMEVPEGP